MILTDREWLRFVSFALTAGAVIGALNTGALLLAGNTLLWAMIGAISIGGVLALVAHGGIRYLLGRAQQPEVADSDERTRLDPEDDGVRSETKIHAVARDDDEPNDKETHT